MIGYTTGWDASQSRDLRQIDTLIFAFAKVNADRATLTRRGARTAARAVRQYLAAGVPPHKLMIGVAFYDREFGDVDPVDPTPRIAAFSNPVDLTQVKRPTVDYRTL